MTETQRSTNISTKLDRIAALAKRRPGTALTTLAHYIDLDWLREAYARTRKNGATGVDGQTAAEYEATLESNLQSLLDRVHSGAYFAPPVRRVHIPKGDGKQTRPIGIPTFEDKVLQRAVAMVLEAVYEQDFFDCSYGFRPGRSAHQALDVLWARTMDMGGGWIAEVDIARFFDTLDHAQLREMLQKRVRDGVLLRLIGKWLNAGVMDSGVLSHPDAGTPQGGVISPLLANVYLHEVLDTWFATEVMPRLKGSAHLVRYADDFVVVFSREDDARRFMDVLPKRFAKYGLTLHPDKTQLVEFRRPPQRPPAQGGGKGGAGTFDLLGFTHFWGLTLSRTWVVKRKTASDRLRRALKRTAEWCRSHRHHSVREQWKTLGQKLKGHYAYYGITGNSVALARFYHGVRRAWIKWLGRRSNSMHMSWDRAVRVLKAYPLPPARLPRRLA
jgi:group II intron reverse transcriptase/maturase